MINTQNIKSKRFDGLFQCGNPDSKEVVFMMGSCRGVPHLNFLNAAHNGRFKIYYVDTHDFHWDAQNNLVDLHNAIDRASFDERIIDAFKSATIFIHEHYGNYGMFNTDRTASGNIYDHGMAAPLDICLPNWHGKFILFQEIADHDRDRQLGSMPNWSEIAKNIGDVNLAAFKDMCQKTSFPEFANYFEQNMRSKRMFFSNNHVSHHFTIPLFQMMCENFLGIELTRDFAYQLYRTPDLYASHGVVPLTRYDVEAHGWAWDEPIHELKL